jgi:hypothetical protein
MYNLVEFCTLKVGELFKFDLRGVTVCEKSNDRHPTINGCGLARYLNTINEFFVGNKEGIYKWKQ